MYQILLFFDGFEFDTCSQSFYLFFKIDSVLSLATVVRFFSEDGFALLPCQSSLEVLYQMILHGFQMFLGLPG